MGGDKWQTGSGSRQPQGVSNPCLRRERRAPHRMRSIGYVISRAIQVASGTKSTIKTKKEALWGPWDLGWKRLPVNHSRALQHCASRVSPAKECIIAMR